MEKYLESLKEVINKDFPVSFEFDGRGSLTKVEYQTSWKTGETTPVTDESGAIVDYKEDYKEESLTKSDIKAIDAWIEKNVVSS